MRTSGARGAFVVLLLLVGLAGGRLVWETTRSTETLNADYRNVSSRLDRLSATVSDIGLAQEAYVAPGDHGTAPFDRAAAAFQRMSTETAALQQRPHAPEASSALHTIASTADTLLQTDARVREWLRAGDVFAASSLVLGDAHDAVTSLTAAIDELRRIETSVFLTARATGGRRAVYAVAGCATAWAIGLIVLAFVPARGRPTTEPMASVEATASAAASPATEPVPSGMSVVCRGVDLAAAADLCTRIARVTSAARLDDLLAGAAGILDATGVIVWMGTGEDLFAAAAFGYDPRIISRLGPIGRATDNATAAAWRTGEMRCVDGDMVSTGAIVAPMFGPDICIGVLALEVRHGLEGDPDARAVAAMIAAQLSTILSGWPSDRATSVTTGTAEG